jgi:hypothetical protein
MVRRVEFYRSGLAGKVKALLNLRLGEPSNEIWREILWLVGGPRFDRREAGHK